MDTIKTATGFTLLVICIIIHMLIACARFFRVSKPAFLIDNIPQISILSFVSMLMGVVLIIS